MFIDLKYQDTTEFLAVDAIALVEKTPEDDFPYAVLLKTGHIKKLSQDLYDQIYAVLHKPSEPSPPVGEPLREIVNGALLQDFIKTKGRKD
jgi:hypothetical protein